MLPSFSLNYELYSDIFKKLSKLLPASIPRINKRTYAYQVTNCFSCSNKLGHLVLITLTMRVQKRRPSQVQWPKWRGKAHRTPLWILFVLPVQFCYLCANQIWFAFNSNKHPNYYFQRFCITAFQSAFISFRDRALIISVNHPANARNPISITWANL